MTWIRRWSERVGQPASTNPDADELARLRRLVRSLESTCEFQQEHIKELARKLQVNEDFLRVVADFSEPSDLKASSR